MAKAPIISPDNSTADGGSNERGDAPVGKGRPTPSRREREKANLRPLVPKGKEEQKAQRERVAEARNRARIGLANGEEKFLPARDKGPQRRYVRDYVDARYSVGEALMPAIIVMLIGTTIPAIGAYITFAIWAFFIAAIIDIVLVTRRLNRKLAEKFGAANAERGLGMYVATRAAYPRFIRTPRPQVKRGEFPS